MRLTPREHEVLQRMAAGARDREIAAELTLAETTVKTHVRSILRKLGVRNRTQAVGTWTNPAGVGSGRPRGSGT